VFTSGALQTLLDIEQQSGIKLLTNDAKLFLMIKSDPGKSVKYYLSKSGLSYRGFYNIFNKLLSDNLIKIVSSEGDRRSKLVY
jgi:hypothetical protein